MERLLSGPRRKGVHLPLLHKERNVNMNEARDLQHPDITRMEATGYPWFPRKITVEATEEDARAYCLE